MAQTNWSCYGSSDGRNERPTMNVLQTEGERLHEQALSSYAHGNFAQAKLLLEKAIALEPYNASFRETKNSFCQANQGPYTYGHHQTGTGRSFLDGEQQKQQYGRGTATSWNSSLARQSWDSGGPQGSATFLNGNNYKARSVRGPWPQQPSGNAAQYFSNTVADSMFSPYWGRSEDFQSLGMNSHFGDPRASQRQTNVSHTGRTNVGPHYTKASNTSQQDGMWGTWTDPAAESDPKPEMSWVNSGYQQSDIPWTPEPRRAASLPNNIRSGANGSTSQSSLRGSMANSTERFSSKGHHGQSSPHTWRSEETSSETNYGLDSFDEVSNMDKVEEWMVKNEASGVPNPPPGLSKPRKNKKKKKKKMPAAPKQESPDTSLQTDKDVSQYSGRSSIIECQNPARTKSASARSCQSDETKSVSKNASYHSPSSKPRTAPFTAESVINSNSDKLSKHINDNPHHSKGFKEKDKSFFDPKRIFVSSDFVRTSQPSGCAGQPDSSKQSKTKSAVSKGEYNTSRKSAFSSKGRREGDGVKATGGSPEDLTNARTTGSRDQTYSCDPQETEADGLADDMERSRLDSSGSLGSEVSGRMTKEEWEEIIKRMYAPLGMPSSSPQEHPGRANGAPSEPTSWEQSPAFQNCGRNFVMPSNTEACALEGGLLPESETVQKLSKMKAGRVNAAEKGCSGSKQGAYVDVKATLGAGILQNSVPVCHADTSIRLTSPAGRQSKILSSEKCKTTESAQSAQASTSCQVPLTKGTGPVPQREKTSPENVNSSFAKPLEKPKVEVSSASSVISGRDATSSKGTSKSASNFSAEPKVEVCSTGLVTSSKVASGGDDVSPLKGTTKRSPEPRVEVSSQLP
ncbi:uncharacterized protein LOC110984374 [Acanthaster planci]|uniref:Uncharacterized protein LOC110984374 n=1 Tax=Acanthaster planci TaxID=133434 RepID=A0A8B7Z5Y5_ACAPL|nr:uncharacterized protein LOC110984374 [Acanthaster planci]